MITLKGKRSTLRFYLSRDALFDATDTLLQEVAIGTLRAGRARSVNLNVRLPRGRTVTGQFVIAVVDATNRVAEINEWNNVIPFGPIP